MNENRACNGAKTVAVADAAIDQRLKSVLDLCIRKTHSNIKRLADEPKAAAWALNGNFFEHSESFYDIGNWTSSFFTGMALLAWRETEDEYFLKQVLRLGPSYRKKIFDQHLDTHHDLGFLTTLYSVALYKLTGNKEHREVGLRAAEVLSRRFNEKGGYLRAWGRMDEVESQIDGRYFRTDNMAIIDGLMNLPLLYWASEETDNKYFHDIAVRYAETVLKYFVRPDGSVIHAMRFNSDTGSPEEVDNFCGFSRNSYWARGAAWAVYGFALSYRRTSDKKFQQASVRLAKLFLNQLELDGMPVWDFRLPAEKPRVRDTSAAAILVCGIQELAVHHAADAELKAGKERLLNRLCHGDWINRDPECCGILKSAYGDKPAYSSWGDYFLMEAVSREIKGEETFW